MGHSSACLKFIKQVRYKLLTGGELVEKEENKIVTNDKRKKEIIQRLQAMNYRITSQRMLLLDIILNGQYSSAKKYIVKCIKRQQYWNRYGIQNGKYIRGNWSDQLEKTVADSL